MNGPQVTRGAAAARGRDAAVGADHWIARRILSALGDPPLRIRLWDRAELGAPGEDPVAVLTLADRGALWRLALDPEMQFGEMYAAGRLRIEGDLVACVESAYRAPRSRLPSPLALARRIRRANTPARSRANVHHHYDIGNEFYALWLDRDWMQYTCAYYPEPGMTLERAQEAKLHHVCRKLRLRPGERVIEAGCGWGGLARFMAREYGARVTAYNLSGEQVRHARRAAEREGLGGAVEFVHADYREIRGTCDAFVSVGMLEHVGPPHYRALGDVIDRCLAPDGRGLIHTIGRDRAIPLNPWIDRRIFPGAHPPTLGEMAPIFEGHGFSVLDVENLRPHYAETLRDWLARFERSAATVRGMFDERFVRTWRLYLAGSVAAFTTGWLQLFQVVFARPGLAGLPRSRAHVYPAAR